MRGSRTWFLFAMLLLLPLLLPQVGIGDVGSVHGLRLNTLQSWAFPFILLLSLVWGRKLLHLPIWIPLCAAFGWLCSLSYQHLAMASVNELRLTMTPAPDDPLGIRGRALERYSLMFAQLFDLAVPQHVEEQFESSSRAVDVARAQRDARLLVVAQGGNWDLVFGTGARIRPCLLEQRVCEKLISQAKIYGIDSEREIAFVDPLGSETPLALVMRPEIVHVPAEPVELSAKYLEWTTTALQYAISSKPLPNSIVTEAGDRFELQEAATKDALSEASQIQGVWKSFSPLAAASAMLGSFRLSERGPLPACVLKDSISDLSRALRLARREYDPETFAMIFNNLAVARLYETDAQMSGEKNIQLLENQLVQAMSFKNEKGQPLLGARAALLNLALLKGLSLDGKQRD